MSPKSVDEMNQPTDNAPMKTNMGRRQDRGASAILVAFMLVALGAMVSLALNVGHLMLVRGQLQNAADAGALAGAMSLRTGENALLSLDQARLSAQEFTQRHRTDVQQVSANLNSTNDPNGDIVLGRWDDDEREFYVLYPATNEDAGHVNAVQVRTSRSGDNALPVFFSSFLGKEVASVGAEAIAVIDGPCEGCSIPIVFAECLVVNPNDGSLVCNRNLTFTNATEDNMGLTMLDGRNPNTAGVLEVLRSPNRCSNVRVGDIIGVSNGASLHPLYDELVEYEGQEVTVPIIGNDSSDCSPRFNQPTQVVGFATFRILDVRDVNEPGGQGIDIEFLCDRGGSDDHALGGCTSFGTTAPITRLVK
ncbi:MAG: hypothetical protein A2289_16080 [Deltaproteobacteria bacterium RIFOXYA12_FULL_58_15]|nr:MAG: hypothetical protein A2289_16080 [Deltaproteobacteria bacterium RIFOXYA12_FULL_58_15]